MENEKLRLDVYECENEEKPHRVLFSDKSKGEWVADTIACPFCGEDVANYVGTMEIPVSVLPKKWREYWETE